MVTEQQADEIVARVYAYWAGEPYSDLESFGIERSTVGRTVMYLRLADVGSPGLAVAFSGGYFHWLQPHDPHQLGLNALRVMNLRRVLKYQDVGYRGPMPGFKVDLKTMYYGFKGWHPLMAEDNAIFKFVAAWFIAKMVATLLLM